MATANKQKKKHSTLPQSTQSIAFFILLKPLFFFILFFSDLFDSFFFYILHYHYQRRIVLIWLWLHLLKRNESKNHKYSEWLKKNKKENYNGKETQKYTHFFQYFFFSLDMFNCSAIVFFVVIFKILTMSSFQSLWSIRRKTTHKHRSKIQNRQTKWRRKHHKNTLLPQ